MQPLASGRWLVSVLVVSLMIAAACVYATVCLLFYEGGWQIIFHPSRAVTVTPASAKIPFEDVQFDYTETGRAQLSGWWIPAEAHAPYANCTILLLHDGFGSLSDSLERIRALHAIGTNVLVFDYRGFGRSVPAHPSEQGMNQDADAAWNYLTDMRNLPHGSIIFYGEGLGAAVAVSAALRHTDASALVIEDAGPTALERFSTDARTKLLPVHWLTSDRFDPAAALEHLKRPKLFVERGNDARTEALYRTAEFPKRLVRVDPNGAGNYAEAMRAFLDDVIQK